MAAFLYILSWVSTGIHIIFATLALGKLIWIIVISIFFIRHSKNIFDRSINELILFITAAVLYYLAELVEEYASYAAKSLRITILVSLNNFIFSHWIMIYSFYFQISVVMYLILFLLEDLPSSLILCGIITHIVHLSILRTFPFFVMSSLPFILGISK